MPLPSPKGRLFPQKVLGSSHVVTGAPTWVPLHLWSPLSESFSSRHPLCWRIQVCTECPPIKAASSDHPIYCGKPLLTTLHAVLLQSTLNLMYSSFTCLLSVPMRLQESRRAGALFTTVPQHPMSGTWSRRIFAKWMNGSSQLIWRGLLTSAWHLLSPQVVYDNCAGDTHKLRLTVDSAFSTRRGLALNADTAHPL